MQHNYRSLIIGAGTYGEVYLSYLKEEGVNVIGFIDDNPELVGTLICDCPVLGTRSDLNAIKEKYSIDAVYCPIGDNKLRVQFLEEASAIGLKTPNFIHRSVIISPNVRLGNGVYILMGSMIMPYAEIEDYVMISMNVCVAHHSKLKKGVFLSTGCNLGASIIAEEYAYCGISSTLMTGIKTIGKDSLIGAGAVVIRDVPDRAVMAGVPAKLLKLKE